MELWKSQEWDVFLISDPLWCQRPPWLVRKPPWSWHGVTAGASNQTVEEARRLEERQKLEHRGWKRTHPWAAALILTEGPTWMQKNESGKFSELKLGTFASRVRFACEAGKKLRWKQGRFARRASHLFFFSGSESLQMSCPCGLRRGFRDTGNLCLVYLLVNIHGEEICNLTTRNALLFHSISAKAGAGYDL